MAVAVANPPAPVLLTGTNEAAIGAHITKQVRNYPLHQQQLVRFLSEFSTPQCSGPHGSKKYLNQLQLIADHRSSVLKVSIDDLRNYFQSNNTDDNADGAEKLDPALPAAVERNCLRYIRLIYEAAEHVKKQYTPETLGAELGSHRPEASSETASAATLSADDDTYFSSGAPQRGTGKAETMETARVPIYLRAPYEVRIVPSRDSKPLSIREVRAAHIGALVLVEGVVTKVSSVKPRLVVAYYKCLDCGADAHQPVAGSEFMPLAYCRSSFCVTNQKKGELRMVLPESKFVRYQEVRIQEPPNRVPPGAIPKTQKIIIEGSLTRKLLPGMLVTLAGVPTPTPKTGFQALRAGLLTETTFLVTDLEIHKQNFYAELADLSSEHAADLQEMLEKYENDPNLYERLARSIAPNIHGLEDVKKALLLQLVGGVTETFPDGMKLRGDIHVLLMGDPGVAKSQLLGQICRIAHRAHYTTGKGSSGVGLTASVVRDSTTGDFTLEGGAIVLSDRGICCIDEFDKMDEYDRTAIHEVMEQQTVSISKAGLTTTLNARTSILAAANPQYGRYDTKKSPMQNINLPAALLSRFDVQFLLLDRADREADLNLARHVLRVHQRSANGGLHGQGNTSNESDPPFGDDDVLPAHAIRLLIAKAKTYKPKLPESLMREIVEYYVDLRQRERLGQLARQTTYTTPRTLFAVLRLTQALARLRFSNIVGRGDFEEALRLVNESKRSVAAEEAERQKRSLADIQSDVIDMIKEMDAKRGARPDWDGWLTVTELEDAAARNGFDHTTLMKTLHAYVELDVLQWREGTTTHIAFTERLAG